MSENKLNVSKLGIGQIKGAIIYEDSDKPTNPIYCMVIKNEVVPVSYNRFCAAINRKL